MKKGFFGKTPFDLRRKNRYNHFMERTYFTCEEIATKWNISERRVQELCAENRITGAVKVGNRWQIPQNALCPTDLRKHIPSGQMDLWQDVLSLADAAQELHVSPGTLRNWVKAERIVPALRSENKLYFLKKDVNALKTASTSRLKHRRNKTRTEGRTLYAEYLEETRNVPLVESVLQKADELDEADIRIVLAEFSLKLFCQKFALPCRTVALTDFLDGTLSLPLYRPLVEELLPPHPETRITKLTEILSQTPMLFPKEDFLGFLYISLKQLSVRKQEGIYYTPVAVVRELLQNAHPTQTDRILDPCCGTGNFLIYFSDVLSSPQNLYGWDTDECSILLLRINVALHYQTADLKTLYENFRCLDSLERTPKETFDYVLGNPPWGAAYPACVFRRLEKHFQTASTKESFDIFTEFAFLSLKPNGELLFVLPQAVTNVGKHLPLRRFLLPQAAFCSVKFLDGSFYGVQCPALLLHLKKATPTVVGCVVTYADRAFVLQKERTFTDVFDFSADDAETELLQKMRDGVREYLTDAEFALGIVTGDNAAFLSDNPTNGEPVLKGSDVFRFSLGEPKTYLTFAPQKFQQCAEEGKYRAAEKIVYRFICNTPVFAYDNAQRLTLNSANIFIPHSETLSIKYILGVLNAKTTHFYWKKTYASVKMLKSHLKSIPLPVVEKDVQQRIEALVDALRNKENVTENYERLNREVYALYALTPEQILCVENSVKNQNLFLAES